jgi:hypothetical protein
MRIDDLLHKLKQVKSSGEDRWMACCPAHDDSTPTLSIRKSGDRILLKCFANCETASVLSALEIESRDLFDDNQTEWKKNNSISSALQIKKSTNKASDEVKPSLALLSKKFKLPVDHLKSIGLADCSRGVEIPYRNFDGSLAFSRHRVAMGGGRKVMQPKGITLIPYGRERLSDLRALPKDQRSLVIVEGESDCWTLWRCGIPAIGLPGASSTKCLESEDVKRITRIFGIQESDEAGHKFVKSLKSRLDDIGWNGEYRVIRMMDPIKDPAELWKSNPAKFKKTFTELAMASAIYGEEEKEEDGGEDLLESLTYRVDAIDRKPVTFLWEPYIPKSVITMFAGTPGLGKSFVSCSLAAMVSSGDYLPGMDVFGEVKPPPPARVLMFCTEDNANTTVRPRLEDCGANMKNIRVFSGRNKDGNEVKLSFGDRGFEVLRKLITAWKPELVIFDPMVSFTGSKIDMNQQNQVRGVLEPLIRIAEESNIAIMLVAHATKGDLAAVMGSQDFTAAPRSVIIAHPDPEIEHGEEGCLLVHAKKNLTRSGQTWRVRIDGARVNWIEAVDVNLTEIKAATEAKVRSHVSPADVLSWLKEELRHGSHGGTQDALGLWWVPLPTIMQRASKYGYPRGMVHSARSEMGNVVQRERGSEKSTMHWAIDVAAGTKDRHGARVRKMPDYGDSGSGESADW